MRLQPGSHTRIRIVELCGHGLKVVCSHDGQVERSLQLPALLWRALSVCTARRPGYRATLGKVFGREVCIGR